MHDATLAHIYARLALVGGAVAATYRRKAGGDDITLTALVDQVLDQFDTGTDVRGQADAVNVRIRKAELAGSPLAGDQIITPTRTLTVIRRDSGDELEWNILCRP